MSQFPLTLGWKASAEPIGPRELVQPAVHPRGFLDLCAQEVLPRLRERWS